MTAASDSAQLITVLGDPTIALSWDEGRWSALVTTARSANLLGALAERMQVAGVSASRSAQRHLDGALQLSSRQRQSVLWEVHQLQRALEQLDMPVLLLKGAAYVIAGHKVAQGRLFGDIDILVPRAALGDVESRLMLNGWVSAKASSYDQRYYRQWMHELPPMTHIHRGTVLDVHHTILPLTARNSPEPNQIIARSTQVALPGLSALHIPCPEDLVIHSITHLVHEGELHNGLRDLRDIDCMLRDFGDATAFWERFTICAGGNDLAEPVHFGLQLARRFFGTPVPETVLVELAAMRRAPRSSRLLQAVFAKALLHDNTDKPDWASNLARWLVYARAHALRMPAPLLVRHLAIKAWMGWRTIPSEPEAP